MAVPGSLPYAAGYRTPEDPFTSDPDDQGATNIDVLSGVLEQNLKAGPGIITSVTGMRSVTLHSRADFDGFPVQYFFTSDTFKQHQFSQELRYAADVTHFPSFTAGAYYFKSSFDYQQSRQLNTTTWLGTRSMLHQNSWALFGEADVKLTPWATLTLGGRYTEEKKRAITAPFGSCTVVHIEGPEHYTSSDCTFGNQGKNKDTDFSPKAALAINLSRNNLLYGSFTRGFRSGGFALRGVPLVSPYGAKKVDAYEIGLKNDLFDHHVRFNVAGYINKFDDLQRTVVSSDPVYGIVQSTFNAASATIKGAELELQTRPLPRVELDGSYGYVHARYSEFIGFANPGALRFARIPNNTWNVSGIYTLPLSSGASVEARASADHSGSYFLNDQNTLRQTAYTLLDASITYTSPDKRWSVAAFGRNLTNRFYGVWGSDLGVLGRNIFGADPRTWGVRATWKMR